MARALALRCGAIGARAGGNGNSRFGESGETDVVETGSTRGGVATNAEGVSEVGRT
jgi:hypothetical protein